MSFVGPNFALLNAPFGVMVGWCSADSPEGIVPAPEGSECRTPSGWFDKFNGGTSNTGWVRRDRSFTLVFRGVVIGTSGSPVDRAAKTIPAGITRWRVLRATILSATATGTLATAQAGIFTQAGGAGVAIVAAQALTPFTAANKIRDLNIGTNNDNVYTVAGGDASAVIRQTVNSGNAGTLDVALHCQDLT